MNDNDFGERFDELRRVNRRNTIGRFKNIISLKIAILETTVSSNHSTTFNCLQKHDASHFKIDPILEQSIEEDPFFAAPIHSSQILPSSTPNKY